MTLEWPIKPPRVWRTLLWLACWLPPLALAQAPWPLPPSAPLLGGFITESRVLYPLRIGDWQARSERRYDDPAAGVSIRYEDPQQPGRWMDVYFYPVGVLAEEQVAEIAADTLQELLTLPSRPESDYVRMQAGKLRAQGVKGEPARQAWRAVLQIDTANESYRSGLGLMFKDLYLLKVRISVPAAQMSAAVMEKKLRTLLADIDAHSAVVSTGDCWNPLPIVARPALRAGAEGGLLEHASNGQLQAVAFADRVEALDENSDAAQLMALLGASLSGRLVAGCVPGEDINPVVPEDGREIRLEYPRQRATDAPTGGRLDPARVTRPLLRPRVGADGYPAIARRSASTSG